MSVPRNNINLFTTLFATSTFQRILSGEVLNRELLLAAEAVLMQYEIPFDVIYTVGTPRVLATAELRIFHTPYWRTSFIFNV